MGGSAARPPVAMTAFRKRRTLPFTSTVLRPVKRPRPWYTSAPAALVPSCESAGAICARFALSLCITAAKSTAGGAESRTPNSSARRTSLTARAERSSALEGTQPTLRQSPPASASEIRQERAPRRAACLADTSPPAPAPMTTRSYTSGGDGSVQRRGWTASSSLALLASSGSISSCRAALASASALGSQRATAETGGVRMLGSAAEGGER
mmetsp:Transcript_491/g.1555  ORF Transcript_491/g.1555 Transcript_491/m.1555 type:complete len:211 (-) Transcript_491:30-662(-)